MNLLRCADCGKQIRGMTGLLELENLRRHLIRKHKIQATITDAMAARACYEEGKHYVTDPTD
jgi:hypothetical protein